MQVSPTMSPTRSGSIIATIAWQPMPPPTSVPGSGACAAVVGTARAVERRSVDGERDPGALRCDHLVEGPEPPGESSRQPGVERGEQRVDVERPVTRHEQVALFVASADHPRVMGAVVERTLQEAFERRVLLLDHHHLVEALGEVASLGRIERDRHQQLEQADAGSPEVVVGDEAEHPQRFADLVERVPGCSDAEPVVDGASDHAVESVVDAVATRERPADLLEFALHVDRVRREQTTVRLWMEGMPADIDDRRRRPHTIGVHVDCARAVGDRGHQLETGPQPARTRERDGVPAQVECLLHIAREEDRHVQVDHRGIARRGERRRLGGGIVTDHGDHAAVHRRPREHGVADRVAAAVEPGPLAVPDADDAVVACVVEGHRELAAHHRSRREFLVHRRLHHDREVRHRRRGPLELFGGCPDR